MEIQFAKRIRLLLFVCALLINFECIAENSPATNCLRSVNFHGVLVKNSIQLNVECEFSDPSDVASESQSYNLSSEANLRMSGCSITENKTISPLLDSEEEHFNIECKATGVFKIHQVYGFLNLEIEHLLKNLKNVQYVRTFLRSYYVRSQMTDLSRLLRTNGNSTVTYEIDCSIRDLSCKNTNFTSTVSIHYLTATAITILLIIIIVSALFYQKLKILIFDDQPNRSQGFANLSFGVHA